MMVWVKHVVSGSSSSLTGNCEEAGQDQPERSKKDPGQWKQIYQSTDLGIGVKCG